MASSTSHRDALVRELRYLSPLPKGLIHMLIVNRATCIVFSIDDLPSGGSDHTLSLYIFVGCSRHRVPYVFLDNGFSLNV